MPTEKKKKKEITLWLLKHRNSFRWTYILSRAEKILEGKNNHNQHQIGKRLYVNLCCCPWAAQVNWCHCSGAVCVHSGKAMANMEFYMPGVWKCSLQELAGFLYNTLTTLYGDDRLVLWVVYMDSKGGNVQALQLVTKQMDLGENADLDKGRRQQTEEWFHPVFV